MAEGTGGKDAFADDIVPVDGLDFIVSKGFNCDGKRRFRLEGGDDAE